MPSKPSRLFFFNSQLNHKVHESMDIHKNRPIAESLEPGQPILFADALSPIFHVACLISLFLKGGYLDFSHFTKLENIYISLKFI